MRSGGGLDTWHLHPAPPPYQRMLSIEDGVDTPNFDPSEMTWSTSVSQGVPLWDHSSIWPGLTVADSAKILPHHASRLRQALNKGAQKTPLEETNRIAPSSSTKYQLWVDCSHKSAGKEGTESKVVVKFLGPSGSVEHTLDASGMLTNERCRQKGQVPGRSPNRQIVKLFDGALPQITDLEFSIHGHNALLLDKVEIWADGELYLHWGKNDGGGWCMSTDPEDASGSWKSIISSCHPKILFQENGKAKKM